MSGPGFSSRSRWIAALSCAGLLAAAPAIAEDDEAIGFERTPPRLSFVDGEVSFLRPGAEDWAPARVNTPLAAGDELYAAEDANLELQVGARAFVRAGDNAQLGLTGLEPDFLQLRVTSGTVSLDLRSLKKGQTLELATPSGAFTVERTGYYRVEVEDDTTTFTSRRGGRATLTSPSGESLAIAASEQVVVTAGDSPQIESYAAPELDAWDRWNYARTDEQIDPVSARYVPSDVYGVDDLDHHGDWRVVPSYGAVWVPRHVGVGWAPYTTGRWIYDPYYGWTWVDDAPWGWAPYHYGRWVHVSGYWGWCPGPIVARPYYAPALVAFFGGRGWSVGVSIGTPSVGWVALGWGEPLVPWWGPSHFRAYPRWAGWGGPRVVNDVVIKHKTVIHAKEVHVYRNTRVGNAFVSVDRGHFGRRDDGKGYYRRGKSAEFRPVHGDHPARPDRSSLVAERGSARRPPEKSWRRSVVATREPRRDPAPQLEMRRERGEQARGDRGAQLGRDFAAEAAPPTRVVRSQHGGRGTETAARPPFGRRGESERRIPPPAPRFERRAAGETGGAPRVDRTERQRRETAQPTREPDGRRTREERATQAREDRPAREERATPAREARRERAPAPPGGRERATAPQARRESPQRPAAREEGREAPRAARSERRTEAVPAPPRPARTPAERSRVRTERREQAGARELPGEPANRVYRQREARPERQERPRNAGRPERQDRPGRVERPSSETRLERQSRPEPVDRPRSETRVERRQRSEARVERPGRPERVERQSDQPRVERRSNGARAERQDRPQRQAPSQAMSRESQRGAETPDVAAPREGRSSRGGDGRGEETRERGRR